MGVSTLILFYIIFSLLIYYLLIRRKNIRSKSKSLKNVLIITAHPDDECLFFGPTIQQFNPLHTHVLCLSTGNYYGLGHLRKKELVASCHVLGVRPMNVAVVESPDLQDDPETYWDPAVAARCIIQHVKKVNAHMIVTFDGKGVSGHRNHASCYHAVQKLVEEKKLPETTKAYSLESVSILRHYISVFDLPYSVLTAAKLFILSPSDVWRTQRAMRAHASQFVWFRILYLIFSRYVIFNTLKKISANK